MLNAVIITVVIIIFPIFINVQIFYTDDEKKLFFGFGIYGIKNVVGGYINIVEERIKILINGKRAVLMPFSSLFSIKSKVKPLKDYHFIRLYCFIDFGGANFANMAFVGFSTAFILQSILNPIVVKKPYLKSLADINVIEGKKTFKIYFSGVIVLNILSLILSGIKILTEKIFYAIRKKAKQN